MSDLNKLADRVEAAAFADVELAKDIFRAVYPERVPHVVPLGQYGWRDDTAGWWLATGEDTRTPLKTIYPPKWLSSLDVAMSLVPEGFAFGCGRGTEEPDVEGWAWCGPDEGPYSFAATPALALTAAALRARALSTPDLSRDEGRADRG